MTVAKSWLATARLPRRISLPPRWRMARHCSGSSWDMAMGQRIAKEVPGWQEIVMNGGEVRIRCGSPYTLREAVGSITLFRTSGIPRLIPKPTSRDRSVTERSWKLRGADHRGLGHAMVLGRP